MQFTIKHDYIPEISCPIATKELVRCSLYGPCNGKGRVTFGRCTKWYLAEFVDENERAQASTDIEYEGSIR